MLMEVNINHDDLSTCGVSAVMLSRVMSFCTVTSLNNERILFALFLYEILNNMAIERNIAYPVSGGETLRNIDRR
jgi:hypothetical protein